MTRTRLQILDGELLWVYSPSNTYLGTVKVNSSGEIEINSAAAFRFQVGGVEKVTILSTGLVGIGTNNPGANLESQITAATTQNIAIFSAIQTTNDYGAYVVFNGGTVGSSTRGYLGFTKSGTGGATLFTNEAANYLGLSGVTGVHIGTTQDTPEITVVGGKVGFGITIPTQVVHVVGAGYFTTGLGVADTNITSGVVNVGTGFRIANAATTGTILRGNGTNYIASTATYPTTTIANQILFSSATNTISEITTANSSILVTNGSGVPSLATDIPTAVTIGAAYVYRVGGTDVSIADGGTGQSTAALAFNALSPMTTLGDIIYGATSGAGTRLAGNITTTRKFLLQVGDGAASSAPSWDAVTKTDVGLSNVENTALSTWAGSTNITTLGTIATGSWNATTIPITKGGTGQITATLAFNALSPMSALGDTIYGAASGVGTRLAGNITTTKKFLTQTGDGVNSVAPSWGTVTSSDVGITPAALTKTDDTNITLTLGGSPTVALLAATSLTLGWTGTLAAARLNANVVQSITNDTNVTGSIAAQVLTLGWTGDLAFSRITQIATGTLLGRNTALTGDIEVITDIPTAITIGGAYIYRTGGTDVPVTDGGTGVSTLADGGLIVGNATNAVEVIAAGLTTQILVGGGALTNPAWGTDLPTAVTIGSAYIYRVAGTDVAVTDGGTGLSIGTSGGILGFTGTTTLASSVLLTANALILGGGAGATPTPLGSLGTTTTVLHGNAAGAPTFGAVSLTADVSGDLPFANIVQIATGTLLGRNTALTGDIEVITDIPTAITIGSAYIYRAGGTDIPLLDGGTNASLTASNGGIVYSTASALAILSGTATANQVLLSGASTTPAWSTATYPATTTVSQILYSSATNTVAGLATGNSSILVTSGTGVPSLATDIPTAVTIGSAYVYRVAGTDVLVTDGGTGVSTLADGGLVVGNGTSAVEVVAAGLTTQILVGGGAATNPAWGTDLPTAVTIGGAYIYRVGGTDLSVADGGTGLSSWTANGIVYASGTGTLANGSALTWDTNTLSVANSSGSLTPLKVSNTLTSGGEIYVAQWFNQTARSAYFLVNTGTQDFYIQSGNNLVIQDPSGNPKWSFLSTGVLQAAAAQSITTAAGALTLAPYAGSNLAVTLNSSGRLAVNGGGITLTGSTGSTAVFQMTADTTYASYQNIQNGTGLIQIGVESSAGNYIGTGYSAYAGVLQTNGAYTLCLGTNSTCRWTVSASASTLTGTGASTIATSSGALTLQPAAGSNLNVTLATTGDFAVNTNQLYVDTSTGNVGIGTTGPGTKLDVRYSGTAGLGISSIQTDTVNAAKNIIQSGDGTTSARYVYQSYIASETVPQRWDVGLYGTKSYTISDVTAGLDRLTITTTGNVGIGTTNPGYSLEVYKASGTPLVKVTTTGAGEYYAGSYFSTDDSDVTLVSYDDGYTGVAAYTGKSILQAGGGNLGLAAWNPSSNIEFYAGGRTSSELRMFISSSGNVGIGTTEPVQKLSFGGTDDSIGWANTAEVAGWNNAASNVSLLFKTTSGGAGAQTTKMIILGSGNVGIGTINPGNNLEVVNTVHNKGLTLSGSGDVSPGLRLISGGTGAGNRNWGIVINNDVSGDFGIRYSNAKNGDPFSAGTSALNISSTGNVGIGTTAPVYKLTLYGTSGAIIGKAHTTDAASYSSWDAQADNGSLTMYRFGSTYTTSGQFKASSGLLESSAGELGLSAGGASNIRFYTNAAEKVCILSGGNVGIGTTNPSSFLLQLAGNCGPNANRSYNLGSTALRWNQIWTNPGTTQQIDNGKKYEAGLWFSGETGQYAVSTLTSTNDIGTGKFSTWVRIIPPTANPSVVGGICAVGTGSASVAGTSFALSIDTSGQLVATLYGATTSDFRKATISSFVANFGGQVVDIVTTRSGATFKIYINGVDTSFSESTGGTPPAWSATVGSDYAWIGRLDSSTHFAGTYYKFVILNLALTQSEVDEFLCNDVPTRMKYGYILGVTSGTLYQGIRYVINTYVAGDDFTNVGGTNVTGTEFISTGITPTTWTNSSSLSQQGAFLNWDFSSTSNFALNYGAITTIADVAFGPDATITSAGYAGVRSSKYNRQIVVNTARTNDLHAQTSLNLAFTPATGTNNVFLTLEGGVVKQQVGASGSGVTSVAMSVPAQLSVAGSPITSSGTLAVSWVDQNANIVLAGPSSGAAAAPTFRSLVWADLPVQTLSSQYTEVGNVGSGEDDLMTYTVAAGKLTNNGDRLRIVMSGSCAANTNAKTIKYYVNGVALLTDIALELTDPTWRMEIDVIRIDASTGRYSYINHGSAVTASSGSVSVTWSGTCVIKCTGTATSNNDVVQNSMYVEYYAAP